MKILAIDPGNEERNHKVYKHTSPSNKIYIGITKLSLYNRFRNGKGYKHNNYFSRAIHKYGWENFVTEVLFDGLTYEEASNKEIELIKKYDSNNKIYGYNIEIGGGKGSLGIKRSKKTLEKLRKVNQGKIVSQETRDKISNSLKGRVFTEKHRRNKSLAQTGTKNHRFGIKASLETRKKMSKSQPKGKHNHHSVSVYQIDIKTNKILKKWDCMSDIRRIHNYLHCCISDCCRGKQKTAYGYKWAYMEEYNA